VAELHYKIIFNVAAEIKVIIKVSQLCNMSVSAFNIRHRILTLFSPCIGSEFNYVYSAGSHSKGKASVADVMYVNYDFMHALTSGLCQSPASILNRL